MNSMNYIGKVISNVRDFYNEINTATLTGAIDVVVVEQADGTFNCSPFHVRFGKLGVLRSREKVVDIEINGEPLDLQMKLGESGEAFFVEEVPIDELGDDEFIPPHLACSPIPSETFLSRYHSERGDEWHGPTTAGFKRTDLTDKDVDAAMRRPKWPEVKDGARKTVSSPEVRLVKSPPLEISLLVSGGGDETDHAGGTVKMFRAETMEGKVSEKVRRISIVTGEFRPISLEQPLDLQAKVDELSPQIPLDENSTGDRDKLRLGLAGSSSQELAVDSVAAQNAVADDAKAPSSGNKKKRRKKSFMKKKAGAKKNGGSSSSQTEQSETSEAGGKENIPAMKAPFIESAKMTSIVQITDSAVKDQLNQSVENIFEIDDLGDGIDFNASSLTANGCGDGDGGHPMKLPLLSSNAEELASLNHPSNETNFHFFSDTEVTPGSSPLDSRPNSPIQSDTEAEKQRHADELVGEKEGDEAPQSWRWGELPTPPTSRAQGTSQRQIMSSGMGGDGDNALTTGPHGDCSLVSAAAAEAAKRSIISDMFSFMKKTKRLRHNPEGEGIYLADIKSDQLDPEVAALYFPTSYRQAVNAQGDSSREEDGESGNGTSLPQSPHSVDGSIGGPKSSDSDFGEPKHSIFPDCSYNEISMSLCGGLNETGPNEEAFLQSVLTYEDLVADPKLIENPDLVVRLDGKYYNWKTACPMVMSVVLYQRALPQHVIDEVTADYMPHPPKEAVLLVGDKTEAGRGYSSWFSWRKSTEPKKMEGSAENSERATLEILPGQVEPVTASESLEDDTEGDKEEHKEGDVQVEKLTEKMEIHIPGLPVDDIETELTISTLMKLPGSIAVPTDVKEDGYNGSNSSDDSDASVEKRVSYLEHSEMFRKTLRLSSEQIAGLNLVEGANEVVFSVTTAYQGTTRCKCHIYKWRYDDKIVVSDIDGTITKSDVLGHILPIVGKDWAQSGVAQLFTKIQNNGYRLLYLSARAIGQARVTREYLRSIRQGDLSLPDGPLLLNPTSLISAFHREVIEKKPEEFKISCLRDIHALFPADSEPFYAGYGNKVNDVWAYRAVGIPIFRIFTINHRGELKHELTQTFQSSYSNMSFIVDQMFPPPPTVEAAGDFSSFVFWRDPIPDIIVELPIKKTPSKTSLKVPNNKKKSPPKAP